MTINLKGKMGTIPGSMENALFKTVNALIRRLENVLFGKAAVQDAAAAGKIKTVGTMTGKCLGIIDTIGAADPMWDLSGETDTGAAEYRAYLLLHDLTTATFLAGASGTTAAAAIANLEAVWPADKIVMGTFVADPSCDFDDAGGLAAQGTYYNGYPNGIARGVLRKA